MNESEGISAEDDVSEDHEDLIKFDCPEVYNPLDAPVPHIPGLQAPLRPLVLNEFHILDMLIPEMPGQQNPFKPQKKEKMPAPNPICTETAWTLLQRTTPPPPCPDDTYLQCPLTL